MKKFIEVTVVNQKTGEEIPTIMNLDCIVMVTPLGNQKGGCARIILSDTSILYSKESYDDIHSTIANIQGGFHIKAGTESVRALD